MCGAPASITKSELSSLSSLGPLVPLSGPHPHSVMPRQILTGLLVLLSTLLPLRSSAQQAPVDLHFGADFVSRYVVRGLDFGRSPSVQPVAVVSAYGFDAGTWGNYSLTNMDDYNGAEQDFWIGYTATHDELGSLRVSLFDYHFPEAGSGFFDVSDGGRGGHLVEAQVHIAPASLPVYLFAGRNIYNDPDGSWYAEAGLTPRVGEVDVTLSAGIAGGGSAWYRTSESDLALINTSLKLARSVRLTEQFALPLHASFVLNPHAERVYLVFGFSL